MGTIVVTALSELPAAPSVVTIGAFDGVHRGHQHLIHLARQAANENNQRLVAVTFDPLPGEVFSPHSFPGRIVTNQHRRELLFEAGADAVVELQFSREMARETASEFTEELRRIGPIDQIWTGDDFSLGYKREGTPSRLQELLWDHGTTVHAIPRISHERREVSSSAIRQHILDGSAKEASIILGRRFQIAGEVVQGAQIGRQIGFPTANVAPPKGLIQIRDGIYVSYARVGDEETLRPAMTYIGTRPAVNTGERMIETHLLDFEGDLYGKVLTTEFVTHIRPDSDFPSVDALVNQLAHDERATRAILGIG